jgi:adenylate cyclase
MLAGLLCAALLFFSPSLLATFDAELSDQLATPYPPQSNIVIIAIDDRSLASIGRWPWPLTTHAQLVQLLQQDGAALVGFDIGFHERPTDPREALALANAAHSAKNVLFISGADIGPQAGLRNDVLNAHRILPPIPQLQGVEAGTGTSNVIPGYPGNDHIVRVLPLQVTDGHQTMEAFSMALYRVYNNLPRSQFPLQRQGSTLVIGTRHIPVGDYSLMYFNYAGKQGTFPHYSYSDVVDGAVPASAFKGSIVLIGAYNAIGLPDAFETPTTTVGNSMAGVEIHANALSTLLKGNFLSHQGALSGMLTVLLLAVLIGAGVGALRVQFGLAVTVVALAAYRFYAGWLFGNGTIAYVLYPLAAIGLTFLAVAVARYWLEERERQKVTRIFGQYVKPEIVAELVASGQAEDVQLGGVRREVSVLFADIRGSTAIAEKLTPEQVVSFLNAFTNETTKAIMDEDGTLDKYVGDEVVALWNAPQNQADHALRAVRAGMKLVEAVKAFRESDAAKDMPFVQYGVGVNSGDAVVGHMGSSFRKQYTAIGDTINVGARLCANAPGDCVHIAESTYDQVREHVKVEALEPMHFKGKSQAMAVYRVLRMLPEVAVAAQAATAAALPAEV